MRSDEREALDRTVFSVQCALDEMLRPENVPHISHDIRDIITRCTRALERRNAA